MTTADDSITGNAVPDPATTGSPTDATTRPVTVRFFAAAKAAAGTGEARVPIATGASVDELLGALGEQFGPGLTAVVEHSSFLLDGVGVERGDPVGAASGLDILPPFAGG